MKIRGILLTLFLSFSGIGLVGCGLFDAVKEISAAAAKKIAEGAKTTADEAKKAAEKEKTDNPGADHSVCDDAINEANDAVTQADAAIAAAKTAESGTADDVTTAHNQAEVVKKKAEAAKTKAKDCAKEKEAAGTPGDTANCNPSQVNNFICKDGAGKTTLYLSLITYDTSEAGCATESKLDQYHPENKNLCTGASADCTKQKDDLVSAQTTAGNSCQ